MYSKSNFVTIKRRLHYYVPRSAALHVKPFRRTRMGVA